MVNKSAPSSSSPADHKPLHFTLNDLKSTRQAFNHGQRIQPLEKQPPSVQQPAVSEKHTILCVTESKGKLSRINDLVQKSGARAVLHCGGFGFYDSMSHRNLSDREIRNLVQYSDYIDNKHHMLNLSEVERREALRDVQLSELQDFMAGKKRFIVPVYVLWGREEDLEVVRRFQERQYHVPNLYLLDPSVGSYVIPVGSVNLRIFGLGGSCFLDRLYDLGRGTHFVSGARGSLWINILQIANIMAHSARLRRPRNEVRILMSCVNPGREVLLNMLARFLGAEYTVSGGLHNRLSSWYTDFTVHSPQGLANVLQGVEDEVRTLWENYKTQESPSQTTIESVEGVFELFKCKDAFLVNEFVNRDIWHLNLSDIAYGHIQMDFELERVSLSASGTLPILSKFPPRLTHETFFVNNVPKGVSSEELKEKVLNGIPTNRVSLLNSGTVARVEVRTKEALEKAITQINGVDLNGQSLTVSQ